MKPESEQLESILAATVEIASGEERRAFVERACAGEAELEARVEALIENHFLAGSFLESPAHASLATADEQGRERPGTVIGSYKLLEQIGEGGFGVVFMAEQTQPVRRKVALKILKPGMDSRQVIARFEAERQALALMDHPNIAHIHDGGTTESGRPYFVMELVRGVPITDFCDQNHLPVRERLELFIDVCAAVQHAHQKGIIHRDIKPSNVLVTLHDDRAVVKVIDFGIAKAIGQQLTDKTLFTNFAQMIGTPLYVSPEQAQMSGLDVDTRSDVYALGVMLYELLTGTTPFDRERLRTVGFDEIRRIIREEDPPRPSTRLSTLGQAASTVVMNRRSDLKQLSRLVRGDLDWIVMKALEKDRNRRFESASAFAADVQRYRHDEPVLACPPSAAYRLGKFLRRNKGPMLAAALILPALFAAGIGAAFGLIEAGKQQEITSLLQQTEDARDREAKARREADDARGKLAAVEYGRTIQLAYQEWRDNNVPGALALLDGTRVELRGWEWRYVRRLCNPELGTFRGHTSGVLSVSFSADGTRLVTGSEDRTVRVWDAKTRGVLLVLEGHTGPVSSASFSADGARVVSAGFDLMARVWDAHTGAELLALEGHKGALISAAFSPDGARVVAGGSDRTARVWDAKTGAELLVLEGHKGPVTSVAFSPDGTRVLTGGDTTAKMWDAKAGTALLTLRGHTGIVSSAAFSADGTRVVTGSRDRTARVWDAKTGTDLLTLRGHTGIVSSSAFGPDGSRVVTGSFDRTARVWDAKTGVEILSLKGHTKGIAAAAFSPDGSRVVTGSGEPTARVWDAKTGAEFRTLEGHTAAVRSAAFSPDGSRVVTGSHDRTARVWDAKTGAELLALEEPTGGVPSAAFSADGTRVVTGCYGRTPAAWDPQTGAARVWDARTGAKLLALRGHTSDVWSVSFSPDGARVLTGSGDNTAKVWDARTGAELFSLEGHTGIVLSVSFSPDGTRLVTGSGDKTAKLWDARTGAELLVLRGHTGDVWSVSFSPDGARVLTGSGDNTAKVWDAKTGAELHTLESHTGIVWSAAFSPDGLRVLTGSTDNSARLWDAKTGAEVLTLKGHTAAVRSAAFSPDGSRVLTGSADKTAKLWDAPP